MARCCRPMAADAVVHDDNRRQVPTGGGETTGWSSRPISMMVGDDCDFDCDLRRSWAAANIDHDENDDDDDDDREAICILAISGVAAAAAACNIVEVILTR